jgi:hypothetical protein
VEGKPMVRKSTHWGISRIAGGTWVGRRLTVRREPTSVRRPRWLSEAMKEVREQLLHELDSI